MLFTLCFPTARILNVLINKCCILTCSWLSVFPIFLKNRLPVPALQENFSSLLGVLKESVQLNLAPPGYFLLLRYHVTTLSLCNIFFWHIFYFCGIFNLKLTVSRQHAEWLCNKNSQPGKQEGSKRPAGLYTKEVQPNDITPAVLSSFGDIR